MAKRSKRSRHKKGREGATIRSAVYPGGRGKSRS
jgi:hypothetical protein